MLLLLVWTLAALGIGLCALLSWGLYEVLRLDPAWLADLPALAQRLPGRDALEGFFPGWERLLQASVDVAQRLLGWAGDAAPAVAWVFFGLGSATVLTGAGLLSAALLWWRRRHRAQAQAQGQALPPQQPGRAG